MIRKFEKDVRAVERICFLRGLADARITLLPRNWFRMGISRGNGPRGNGLDPAGGGAVLAGKAPCSIAAASYVGGGSAGSAAIGALFFSDIVMNFTNNDLCQRNPPLWLMSWK